MWSDVSPAQLEVVWRDRQTVDSRGRASPGVLAAPQQRTSGAFGLEDSHLARTGQSNHWAGRLSSELYLGWGDHSVQARGGASVPHLTGQLVLVMRLSGLFSLLLSHLLLIVRTWLGLLVVGGAQGGLGGSSGSWSS